MWRPIVSRSFLSVFLFLVTTLAAAQAPARFCIFDPAGEEGDLFGLARQYLEPAGALQLEAYVSERIAVEDFKAGQCDGLAISTLRARQFNPFVGSIDAFGGLPGSRPLKALLALIAGPALAPEMVRGNYEVAGVVPLGALYVLVRDRGISSVERAAGRKVGVLDWDKSQARLVEGLAAQPVASDVASYGTRFNNGQVDIIAAPALLFRHFEVERGLGRDGAVYRFPVAQLSATLLIRRDRFPAGFGARLRQRAAPFADISLARVQAAEAAVPARYWLSLDATAEARYQRLLADARRQLTLDGVYDPRMIALLHRLRCRDNPAAAECTLGSL